jgi:hypothetical protein
VLKCHFENIIYKEKLTENNHAIKKDYKKLDKKLDIISKKPKKSRPTNIIKNTKSAKRTLIANLINAHAITTNTKTITKIAHNGIPNPNTSISESPLNNLLCML